MDREGLCFSGISRVLIVDEAGCLALFLEECFHDKIMDQDCFG